MFKPYKKIVARSFDFVPIIGPFLMIVGYIQGIDLVSKKRFKKVSRRGFGFLGSAIFTLIINIIFFGELLHIAGYIVFPFSFQESTLIILLLVIASYSCYAIFLGIDLFEELQKRINKKSSEIIKHTQK